MPFWIGCEPVRMARMYPKFSGRTINKSSMALSYGKVRRVFLPVGSPMIFGQLFTASMKPCTGCVSLPNKSIGGVCFGMQTISMSWHSLLRLRYPPAGSKRSQNGSGFGLISTLIISSTSSYFIALLARSVIFPEFVAFVYVLIQCYLRCHQSFFSIAQAGETERKFRVAAVVGDDPVVIRSLTLGSIHFRCGHIGQIGRQ